MENNLIDALKENKKLIDDFKGKNKENSKDFDLRMLKGILKNKKIRTRAREGIHAASCKSTNYNDFLKTRCDTICVPPT